MVADSQYTVSLMKECRRQLGISEYEKGRLAAYKIVLQMDSVNPPHKISRDMRAWIELQISATEQWHRNLKEDAKIDERWSVTAK